MYDYKKTWTTSQYDASANPDWIGLIKKHLIPGSVIDIGCGSGRFISAFEGHDYLGVDISPISIGACKHNNPDMKFEVRDIVEWNTKRKFDNAFTWTVLEHIPEDYIKIVAQKIKNLAQNVILIEPSGFTNIPNHHCISHDYEKLFGAEMVEDFQSVKMWRINAK